MKKTLGGDRLGAGKKMQVELHGYGRSTHDLSKLWRSTMSAGTLVPFMVKVALPGDTWDIDLDCIIKTHPTIGPLFGSYKVQLDVFEAPIRLYQALLHNNAINIGRNMSAVKLPLIELQAKQVRAATDLNNAQINPSCILAYLGIRGIGWINNQATETALRYFNGIPLLAYWEIYKNYYANKQEEEGAVIHKGSSGGFQDVDLVTIDGTTIPFETTGTPFTPADLDVIEITYTGNAPEPSEIIFNTNWFANNGDLSLQLIAYEGSIVDDGIGTITASFNSFAFPELTINYWRYIAEGELPVGPPRVARFPLENIDLMRDAILAAPRDAPYIINELDQPPYRWVTGTDDPRLTDLLSTQEGLGLKTYQSDLFNNWLNTEWIDGPGGINEITAVDTSGGSFSIEALILARKVFDMLNRIIVSGGTYDDWMDVVYDNERYTRCESPIYHGGLIKELIFDEVVSNSQATGEDGEQPLGTLAGRGVMAKKHKGGKLVIKTNEISYLIGIVSITPRVDYSQGNRWDTHLLTVDDFHKPPMDGIGFQELITEQMAWWATGWNGTTWVTTSAGKQPAWTNYMTDISETYGNFAIDGNEMFMTLNRKYESDPTPGTNGPNSIIDLTTYIDPVKYNNIFAETAIDAQNFWTQIAINTTTRRKMSAKIMPTL